MKIIFITAALFSALVGNTWAQTILSQAVSVGQNDRRHDVSLIAGNVIEDQARVTYTASKSVLLIPGFTVKPGAVFSASIGYEPGPDKETGKLNELSATAYPNPFRDAIHLDYQLRKPAKISYRLLNLQGRAISQHTETDVREAGNHSGILSGESLPSGIYLLELQTTDQKQIIQHKVIRMVKP